MFNNQRCANYNFYYNTRVYTAVRVHIKCTCTWTPLLHPLAHRVARHSHHLHRILQRPPLGRDRACSARKRWAPQSQPELAPTWGRQDGRSCWNCRVQTGGTCRSNDVRQTPPWPSTPGQQTTWTPACHTHTHIHTHTHTHTHTIGPLQQTARTYMRMHTHEHAHTAHTLLHVLRSANKGIHIIKTQEKCTKLALSFPPLIHVSFLCKIYPVLL